MVKLDLNQDDLVSVSTPYLTLLSFVICKMEVLYMFIKLQAHCLAYVTCSKITLRRRNRKRRGRKGEEGRQREKGRKRGNMREEERSTNEERHL